MSIRLEAADPKSDHFIVSPRVSEPRVIRVPDRARTVYVVRLSCGWGWFLPVSSSVSWSILRPSPINWSLQLSLLTKDYSPLPCHLTCSSPHSFLFSFLIDPSIFSNKLVVTTIVIDKMLPPPPPLFFFHHIHLLFLLLSSLYPPHLATMITSECFLMTTHYCTYMINYQIQKQR